MSQKKEVEAYEEACRTTRRRTKESGTEAPVQPREPLYYYPLIPADISKSRLLIHQRDNQGKGGLMFDLEADTLSAAGKQDYGNFFDFLRKFFQHETTSASFKAQNPYKVKEVLGRLAEVFTTRQFLELALQYKFSASSAKRVLKSVIGLKINKLRNGVYRQGL